MDSLIDILPHVNASLNAVATLLLITGVWLIKDGREIAHKWAMLGCFVVSTLFLGCYLLYHSLLPGHGKPFPDYPPTAVRVVYYAILISHILFAAATPFLAIITIYLGLMDQRGRHRRWAQWAFPIWLYVSVTGVVVYLMLYQIYPPQVSHDIMSKL